MKYLIGGVTENFTTNNLYYIGDKKGDKFKLIHLSNIKRDNNNSVRFLIYDEIQEDGSLVRKMGNGVIREVYDFLKKDDYDCLKRKGKLKYLGKLIQHIVVEKMGNVDGVKVYKRYVDKIIYVCVHTDRKMFVYKNDFTDILNMHNSIFDQKYELEILHNKNPKVTDNVIL